MKAFSGLHPWVLAVYFLAVLAAAMFIPNPIISGCALLGGVLYCGTLCHTGEIIRDIGFYIPLAVLIVVTNPLFSHNGMTPLFFMNGNAVTFEAICAGIGIAITLIAALLWCKALNRTLTQDGLMLIMGAAPKLALVVTMAMRYVPMLKRRAEEMRKAQKCLGKFSQDSYADRVRSGANVFFALITWSLESSVETAAAMRARGYGQSRRTVFHTYRFTVRDAVLLACILLLAALVIWAKFCGGIDFYYYPAIVLKMPETVDILAYAAFAVLSFLPFVYEMTERLLWKYYRSKI